MRGVFQNLLECIRPDLAMPVKAMGEGLLCDLQVQAS